MNQIKERQNEKMMLRIQYAAGHCYNIAEILNRIAWIVCILTPFTALIPTSTSEWLQLGIPFSLDIAFALIGLGVSHQVSLGASFRKFFDAYVLGVGLAQIGRDERQKLCEKSRCIEQLHPDDAKIQMEHTGRDMPPGKRDWYEIDESLSGTDAVYECQRSNWWWTRQLARARLLRYTLPCALIVIVVFVLLIYAPISFLRGILCCASLILRCIERITVNIRYVYLSAKINGVVENLSHGRTEENVLGLQELIDKRRALPVFEKNSLHRRDAKSYAERYKIINDASTKQ